MTDELDFNDAELDRLKTALASGLPDEHVEFEIAEGVVVWTDACSNTLDILFTEDAPVKLDDAADVLYTAGDVPEEIAVKVSDLLTDTGVHKTNRYFERCDVANSPGTKNYQTFVGEAA